MAILGILMIIAGVGGVGYGIYQNNALPEAQQLLDEAGNLLQGKTPSSPGTLFIIIGAVVAVLGVILAIIGALKKKR